MFLNDEVEITLTKLDKRWVDRLGFDYEPNKPIFVDWRLIKKSSFRTSFITVKCDDCGIEHERRLRDLDENNPIHFCSNCRVSGERNSHFGKPMHENTKRGLSDWADKNPNPFTWESTKKTIRDKNPWAKIAEKNTGKTRTPGTKKLMSESAITAFKNGNRKVTNGWGVVRTKFYKGLPYQSKNELKFIKYFESIGLFDLLDRGDIVIYHDKNNKEHTYHPDFKIKNTDLVFEIKSLYLWNKFLEANLLKKEAAEKLYDYHVIIDNDFTNIKKIIKYETLQVGVCSNESDAIS